MPGHNKAIGGGGFHHVAINARNFDKSVRFYRDVLGCTPKISWGGAGTRAIMLDTGDGNYIELFEKPNLPRPSGEDAIAHLCFRTTDTDAALERARAAGCVITMEPKDVTIPTTEFGPGDMPVRIAFFKGPDGEVIELFQNEHT
jgi:glyoxylase I family protein